MKNPPANAGDAGSIPESGRFLEKEMATHSSILAWKIPWIEEPGGLQSIGCKRAEHNFATEHSHIVDLQCRVNFRCTAKYSV